MAIIKLRCRWCKKYVDEKEFHLAKGLPGAEKYMNTQCFDCRDKLMPEEPKPQVNRWEILDLS